MYKKYSIKIIIIIKRLLSGDLNKLEKDSFRAGQSCEKF